MAQLTRGWWQILEAILWAPRETRVHADILVVLTLHSSPFIVLPRLRMIRVLYHVLATTAGYGEQIRLLLRDLCNGLKQPDLLAATEGVYAAQPVVRAACLEAIKYMPELAARAIPEDPFLASALWLAQHDPHKANLEAAETAWDLYAHELGAAYAAPLIASLNHPNKNVRQAAAEALADAMDDYPTTVAVRGGERGATAGRV